MRFISFNPAMLAAVQAGRKTVTRRRLPLGLPIQQEPSRTEQVRCFTEADALAEGIRSLEQGGQIQWGGVETDAVGELQWFNTPIAAFQNLLESIYPTAWSRNEWVWVVEFQQVKL